MTHQSPVFDIDITGADDRVLSCSLSASFHGPLTHTDAHLVAYSKCVCVLVAYLFGDAYQVSRRHRQAIPEN